MTDTNASVFYVIATYFATRRNGIIFVFPCRSSVLILSIELAHNAANRSDGGVYPEVIATGRDWHRDDVAFNWENYPDKSVNNRCYEM